MAFWRPGAPAPTPGADPWDFDCDAELHRALPVYNPKAGLPLQQQKRQLPIHQYRLDILHALEVHRVVVLSGPTGCGKSTQLPQYLDEAGWTSEGYVVGVTLPRRLAAVTVAARVAQEMNVELGREVGYRIRFDSRVHPDLTRIEFMTEGILLREMLSDPLLTRYSVIVIDEAHERGLNSDLLIGLLRKITRKRRQLRLVISSATVDVESFIHFFGRKQRVKRKSGWEPEKKRLRSGWDDETGEVRRKREEEADWKQLCSDLAGQDDNGEPDREVCHLHVDGRSHPVEVFYLEEPVSDYVESSVGMVMSIHEKQPDGDILLFLTGREEIDATCMLLKERHAEACQRAPSPAKRPRPVYIVPLHGSLEKGQQLKAFHPAPRGARKVVVSTNIAEASVTLDGIVYVIDPCLVKLDTFCPHNGASYLNIVPCSQSSSRQRAGRAGRTRPGFCYRLLTEAAFSQLLPEHTAPELVRSDMKDAILQLKCLGIDDVSTFDFVTQPSTAVLQAALEELYALGAIDIEARVTETHGLRMAHGPLPLTLMRMLLLSAEAPHSCAAEAAVICAMLTLQEPFIHTRDKDRLYACRQSFAVFEGDLVSLHNVFRQWETNRADDREWSKRHMINDALLQRAAQVREQLLSFLKKYELQIGSCGNEVERIQRLACAALFLNAARRLTIGAYRLCRPIDEELAPSSRFLLHTSSVLSIVQGKAPAGFIVSAALQGVGEDTCLMHNTRIRPEWLPELAPHYFQQVLGLQAVADQ
eukprot:TRINITY_DN31583_c0_g1_i1.p1 TRINITY_DN31583_c0_g1~~TRINITY_DN31583_c0_g1_i1.p1  ORF type:complete len:758 (+),score=134.90 TRINITY_DN31583_c0_g1_i1:74-2347(+)